MSSLIFAFLFIANAQVVQNQGVYRSDADELVTINKISALPFIDNLDGIYARPLEADFIENLKRNPQFDFVPAALSFTPEELQADLQKIDQVCNVINADAFFATHIVKTPDGIQILMNFYLTKDKRLFAQAEAKQIKLSDIQSLKQQVQKLTEQIISRIPYRGMILSRQNLRVTINLGSRDGIQKDQILPVIQIISLSRHPKFDFVVGTEKEILGKIQITKVDETLSFANIISEREKETIQKFAKLSALEFVSYTPNTQQPVTLKDQNLYGEHPTAWVPKERPLLGEVGANFGLGNLAINMDTSNGSLDGGSGLIPLISLTGELWVTNEFSVHANLSQAIYTTGNPQGAPSKLSGGLSSYDFLFGYNFRLGPDVWGPDIEALIGYSSSRFFIDDSTPTSFTSQEYNGFKFGVGGSTPITFDRNWGVGAQAFFYIQPNLSEQPVSSGATSRATINQFSIFGYNKVSEHIRLKMMANFELFSANFTGAGTRVDTATSASQRLLTLSGGVSYLF